MGPAALHLGQEQALLSVPASTDNREPVLAIVCEPLEKALGTAAAETAEMLHCDLDVIRATIKRTAPGEAEKMLDHWTADHERLPTKKVRFAAADVD